jgi:hypothetical protein
MTKRRKRGGWTQDGVKVREKKKGSGMWWVFLNHAGQRKSYCKGTREQADAFANEMRAGFKLVEARQRGLTLDELQRLGLAHSDAPAADNGITLGACAQRALDRWLNDRDPEHGSSSPRGGTMPAVRSAGSFRAGHPSAYVAEAPGHPRADRPTAHRWTQRRQRPQARPHPLLGAERGG